MLAQSGLLFPGLDRNARMFSNWKVFLKIKGKCKTIKEHLEKRPLRKITSVFFEKAIKLDPLQMDCKENL